MKYDAFGFARESWTVPLAEGHGPLRDALRAWAAARSVTLDDALPALETRSVRKPGLLDRLFGRDTSSRSLAVVAPGLVVWALLPERAEVAVAKAAALSSVVVDRGMGGRIGSMLAGAKDLRGLSFTATFVDAQGPATAFLGYGREPDGDAFEQRVREGMRDAGNPLYGLQG